MPGSTLAFNEISLALIITDHRADRSTTAFEHTVLAATSSSTCLSQLPAQNQSQHQVGAYPRLEHTCHTEKEQINRFATR